MHEVIILSDEEFYANQQKEKRKMFLEELEPYYRFFKSINKYFILFHVSN